MVMLWLEKLEMELKRRKFNENLMVVFSPEEDRCKSQGSCVAVTGAFGLTICSETIKKLLLTA